MGRAGINSPVISLHSNRGLHTQMSENNSTSKCRKAEYKESWEEGLSTFSESYKALCQSFSSQFFSPQLTLKALCIVLITSPLAEGCTIINCLSVECTACHWHVIKVPSYHSDNNLVINKKYQLTIFNQRERGKLPIIKFFPHFVKTYFMALYTFNTQCPNENFFVGRQRALNFPSSPSLKPF